MRKPNMYYSILCVLATLCCFVGAAIDITITKYGMCEDQKDTPIQYWASFKKINSSVTLGTSKIITPYPLTDECKLDGAIEIFRDNEWKSIYEFKKAPLCQVIEKYGGDLWHDVAQQLHLKNCPIPKGTYELRDYVINYDLLPFKTAPKGSLRSRVTVTRKNELLLCVYAECESL